MSTSNTLKTALLLGSLTGLLLLVGQLIGGLGGMTVFLVIAIAINMGAWWFSDKLALRMSGAKEVSEADAPALHSMVSELSTYARLPKPRVYIIESATPN